MSDRPNPPEKHELISQLYAELSLTSDELTQLAAAYSVARYAKGDTILHEGDTVEYQYYVQSGCLRTYYLDGSGREHTIQFAITDWWISDYTAFFSQEPALLHIEVLADAVLYRISKADMDRLYLEIPALERFYRMKMERAFARFQKRILANLSQSAKERYQSFVTSYPDIEQLVKNYHIASYLGITTESLSRIRRELSNH